MTLSTKSASALLASRVSTQRTIVLNKWNCLQDDIPLLSSGQPLATCGARVLHDRVASVVMARPVYPRLPISFVLDLVGAECELYPTLR